MSKFLPFIILSGIITLLITLLSTNFGLASLIFSMLLSPELHTGEVSGRAIAIRIDDILLIVVFCVWLGKVALNKELGLLRYSRLNLPIGVYLAVLVVSTLWGIAIDKIIPLKGFFYLLKYVEYYILFFMVSNAVNSKKQIKMFMFCFLIVACIVCLYANTTVAQFGRATAPFEMGPGEYGEPNTLGGYLLFIFALISGLWLYCKNMLMSISLASLAVLVFITLLNTLSRGSYLGFIVMTIALTIMAKKRKLVLISVIVLTVIMSHAIFSQKVKHRVAETFTRERVFEPIKGTRIALDSSTSARIDAWKDTFRVWLSSPLLGYGVTGAGFIDSQLPLVIEETGIIGLLAFIWLITTMFKSSFFALKTVSDDYYRGLVIGFISGFIGLLLHSFSAATFIIIRIMEPFWFLAAIVVALPEIKEETGA